MAVDARKNTKIETTKSTSCRDRAQRAENCQPWEPFLAKKGFRGRQLFHVCSEGEKGDGPHPTATLTLLPGEEGCANDLSDAEAIFT